MRDVDLRSLPLHVAGEISMAVRIHGMSERLARDTSWAAHAHPTHELLWNERGASTATIESRVWTITPMMGLWIPAGVVHQGRASAATWYRTAHFSAGGDTAVPTIAAEPVAVDMSPLLRLLLARLVNDPLPEQSRLLTEQMVLDVIEPSESPLSVAAPTGDLVRPIAAAVLADPSDRRTLGDWSQAVGASPRTITRAFMAETGTGFSRWQGAVRAHRAVILLSEGTDLESVAESVGYGSVSAFGAAFRRATGRTPSDFR